MTYICGGKIFYTLEEARQYAIFIQKVSRIIVSIEEVKL